MSNKYIKSSTEKDYVVPEYTANNFLAQEDWNKEIANNKQGYLAVTPMTMKEFYEAGGYSYIDDYNYELAEVDAAYDRAQVGYGVKGEQMAKAGLTGSGYSDYLQGQAYAGKIAGQALARQNAMTGRRTFQSDYNQYLKEIDAKKAENLQAVIERAQSVNMNPENFVSVATKLGIPQEDAERGKEALIAYYQSIGAMSPDQSQSGVTGTTGSTTGGKSEAPIWMTQQQKEEATTMKDVLLGSIYGVEDAEGNVVTGQQPTLKAALVSAYGANYNENDPVIQTAIQNAQAEALSKVTENAKIGNTMAAKEYLDRLEQYGLFGEEGKNSAAYKEAEAAIYRETEKVLTDVLNKDTLDDYKNALIELGVTDEEELAQVTDENAREILFTKLDAAYKQGVVSKDIYNKLYYEDYALGKSEVESKNEASAWLNDLGLNLDRVSDEERKELLNDVKIVYNHSWGGIIRATVNGERFRWNAELLGHTAGGSHIVSYQTLDKPLDGAEDGDIIVYNGDIYAYENIAGEWKLAKLVSISDKLSTDAIKNILIEQGKNYTA